MFTYTASYSHKSWSETLTIFKKLPLQFLMHVLQFLEQVLTATVPATQVSTVRAKTRCSLRKQPVKRHKNVANCP